MKLKVFSVYDSKVQAYMQPFYAVTVGAASRSFADACLDESSQMAKHPEDYTFFQVGEFDDSTGVFLEFPAPVSLGNALEYVSKRGEEVKAPQVVRRSGS